MSEAWPPAGGVGRCRGGGTKRPFEFPIRSDLVIIPTGLAVDDLQPGVTLAHELVKHVPRSKIVFALCRVGNSDAEITDAQHYLNEAGYEVLEGALPEQVAYRRASDEGQAATETRFSSLNKRAEILAQSIVNKIANLTRKSKAR